MTALPDKLLPTAPGAPLTRAEVRRAARHLCAALLASIALALQPIAVTHAVGDDTTFGTGYGASPYVLKHVTNVAALTLFSRNYNSLIYPYLVERDDVGMFYADTGANCTIGVAVVSTTASAASTSTTITVASGTSVAAGQLLTGTGVPAGDDVVSVSGTSVVVQTAVNVPSGAALTFSTPGDGGWQVQPVSAPSAHCWQADLSKGAPITMWPGTASDDATDNEPAMQAAVNAMSALGGGRIIIPQPKKGGCWLFKSTVTITTSFIGFEGQPGGSCLDDAFATGSGIELGGGLGNAAGQTIGNFVSNLAFKHSVVRTANADVEIRYTFNPTANNITCHADGYRCIDVGEDSFGAHINNPQVDGEGYSGISLACNISTSNILAANVTIAGGNVGYQHQAAVEACGSSGTTIHDLNTDQNTHGFYGHPNTGQVVSATYVSETFFDANTQEGFFMTAAGGGKLDENVTEASMWVASCGSTIAAATTANTTNGAYRTAFTSNGTATCLKIDDGGTAANSIDNRWFGHVFNSGGHGFGLNGGINNQLGGISTGNGQSGSASLANVAIGVGTSHWSWDGTAGGTSGVGGSTKTAYGVLVSAGASDYYSISGDLSGNGTAPLSDGGTGLHKTFENMLPAQAWQPYSVVVTSSGTAIGTVNASGSSILRGQTVFFTVQVGVPSGSAVGTGVLSISLPIAATSPIPVVVSGRDDGLSPGPALVGNIANGNGVTNMQVFTATGAYPAQSGSQLVLSGSYPIASP